MYEHQLYTSILNTRAWAKSILSNMHMVIERKLEPILLNLSVKFFIAESFSSHQAAPF